MTILQFKDKKREKEELNGMFEGTLLATNLIKDEIEKIKKNYHNNCERFVFDFGAFAEYQTIDNPSLFNDLKFMSLVNDYSKIISSTDYLNKLIDEFYENVNKLETIQQKMENIK